MPTLPTTEAGGNWLECIEYKGRGAEDPTGGSLPEGFGILDMVELAQILRGGKIVQVPVEEIRRGDRVIKAILREDLIAELYEENPRAILLSDAVGASGMAGFTRLEWYKRYGRDGLRTWATSRLAGVARRA